MTSFKMKHAVIAAAVASGTVFSGPAVGQPYVSKPVYDNWYYDINGRLIHYAQDICNGNKVETPIAPAGTASVTRDLVAYCNNGQLAYI